MGDELLLLALITASAYIIVSALIIRWIMNNRAVLQRRVVHWMKALIGKKDVDPRFKYKVNVTLESPDDRDRVFRTTTADISPDGMFIKLDKPLPKEQLF